MPIVNQKQDIWKVGSRLFVIESDGGPILDLGTIETVSPTTEIENTELEDGQSGVKRTLLKEVSKFTESYEVTLFNLNMRNLRYLFFADEVKDFTQSSTTLTSVPLPIWPGGDVKVRAGTAESDEFLYNLSAINEIRNAAGTTIPSTGGTSGYSADLERGIISFGTSASAATSGEYGEIDLITNEVSGSRLLRPQTKQGNFQGKMFLEWNRGNFAQRTVREFTGQITPGTGAFSVDEYSNFPITVEVIADPTSTTSPAGRLVQYKGDIPTD